MTREDRSPPQTEDPAVLDRRIAAALRRACLVAAWEEIWRRAVPVLWIAGLYVALVWLGVFTALPGPLRLALLALLAALALAALVRAVADRAGFAAALDRAAALRRVETASALSGHELTALTDRLAGLSDPATERLWQTHRTRLAARIGRLASGSPHPDLGRRDRWALRPLLGFALFIGWFAAAGDHLGPLLTPLAGPVRPEVEDRLDAWIDPPAHTGRAPRLLIAEGRLAAAGAEANAPLSLPQGSRLVVRSAAGRPDRPPKPLVLTLVPAGGAPVEVTPADPPAPPPATTPVERRATLTVDTEIRLERDGARLGTWKVAIVPDLPPTIRLIGRPEVQTSGALKLGHETADDWGVVAAEARLAPAGPAKGRPLYTLPTFPLALPLGRAHTGVGRTVRDLTAHPLAGTAVRLTLHARDEIGQEGSSDPVELTLPERPFRKPLARALAELRRRLATDAGEVAMVATAIDALTLAPDRFDEKPATHLGLRFLRGRAMAARSDDELRDLVDLLWTAATTLEDGDLAEQEKALRQAQEALRKALEEGASPAEIARLTDELRRAMDRYLAAKAEQARRDPRRRAERGGPQKTITQRDIQRMLDRIENLARTGSREAAEKLLQELRELMENLETGSASGEGEGQGGEALEQLGDMIRRQQKLMEDTHRADRGDGEGSAGMGRLGDSQKELRDALRRFADDMKGRGGSGEGQRGRGRSGGEGEGEDDGSDDLSASADAMGEAGEALGRGEGEGALDAQTRALESLRNGARKLADRMTRGNGRGGRDGADGGEEDPFGRPRRRDGTVDNGRVKVPDEIDVERARRILDDIRRRLGEPARPKFERDYLDRLLDLDR